MQTAVDADWQYARSVGVTSVPTFAVGMTGVIGAQPYEQLARLLEYAGAVLAK
jgi:predicted DsbA family dithiol-disulfide isomerase